MPQSCLRQASQKINSLRPLLLNAYEDNIVELGQEEKYCAARRLNYCS